jgi:tetratricopeptide (TPR) repeat protein
MANWMAGVALTLASGAAVAADQPRYGPPAPWVKPIPIPSTPDSVDGSSTQILLQDNQGHLGVDADELYTQAAIKILKPQGLSALANIMLSWRPDTETLVIHHLNILRAGQTIDLLAGGKKMTVLRRETNLEQAALDGALTATLQPEGLQVGDVLDLAATTERRDPVLKGYSEAVISIQHSGVAGRINIQEMWPDTKPVRWRATEGLPTPKIDHATHETRLTVSATDMTAPKPPRDAPSRFNSVGLLELSQFQTWSEVSALMSPLYEKAAAIGSNSPLREEVEKIRRASPDPKIRAEAALRLVQDKVHYVFLGMNLGGYVPADADLTWSRRFGDCKGKTALLLALLKELGIEARPAMVNTTSGDGLDQRLPGLWFDHVLVRATIGGKTFWLDGTRLGDRDLNDIPIPNVHWALAAQPSGGRLEKVEPPPLEQPSFESVERLDASAGLDTPSPAHVEQIFRGDDALGWRISLDALGRADAERELKDYWRKQISWIDPKTVDYAYDEERHTTRLSLDGAATMDWTKNGSYRTFDIGDSNLGFTASFKREPGPHADAPFAINYPSYSRWTVTIVLPNKGAGFSLAGASPHVDEVIAGRRFQRDSQLENGVATMTASELSLAPEFPYSEAQAAGPRLTSLSESDVFVRSPAIFEEAAGSDEGEAAITPTDAAGFNIRGVEFLHRHDYDKAVADFTEAKRRDPKAAKYVYNRGVAHFEKGDDGLALADFNEAIRLDPTDTTALLARADLNLTRGNRALAVKDYEAATRISPTDVVVLSRRAYGYERSGLFEAAVRAFDVVIAQKPDKKWMAGLLNDRCWAKAEWGHELQGALADCDAALVLKPDSGAIFDSRGFVRFRLDQYGAAITDYDEALRLSAGRPSSLFGRGLAELALGQSAKGAADIAAARVAEPAIDGKFARFGVKAPTASKP